MLHWVDKAQSSPQAVYESVYDSYVSSAIAGCSYLELRMNPTKRSQNGVIDLDLLLVYANAGMEKAKVHFGISGGLLLCMGRDCTTAANQAVAEKTLAYLGKGVIGIDIAGPYNWPWVDAQLYTDVYTQANKLGATTTVHCGEVNHANVEEEIHFVLTKLKPKRIGHGIQLVRYPDLLKQAVKQETIFEICITSNLATGVVSNLNEYASILNKLEEAGAEIQLCTDATSFLGTTIKRENQLYQQIKAS